MPPREISLPARSQGFEDEAGHPYQAISRGGAADPALSGPRLNRHEMLSRL